MNSSYHVPVLSQEVVAYLVNDRSGIYVDCTLGGGGHAKRILNTLSNEAGLIGIDQDKDALNSAKLYLKEFKNVQLVKENFKKLETILGKKKISKVNGILLDLGVSSFQINSQIRGFSYNIDTDLDMRMDQDYALTAAEIVNNYSSKQLSTIFFKYGEEKKSRVIAKAIVKKRASKAINTTFELRNIIEGLVHPKYKIKSFARIFQALRIEVNQELKTLEKVLDQTLKLLKSGGRLVVISYHSLEDRLVKNFLKYWEDPCQCPKEIPVCMCDKKPEYKIINKKVIKPSTEEIKQNTRARSALMRVGEKI